MNRREALRTLGSLPILTTGPLLLTELGCSKHETSTRQTSSPLQTHAPEVTVRNEPSNFDASAAALLEEICVRGSRYFFDQADPGTGLVLDRAPVDGVARNLPRPLASTAATGFGLGVLCVAAERGYLPRTACEQRILTTLEFLARRAQAEHGFFAHYLDAKTGNALYPVEFSSMDTALLLAGVLQARHTLNSSRAETLANEIYSRVDWPWMLDRAASPGAQTLAMTWRPDAGFSPDRWSSYSECLLMYLLAIGAPRHPLPRESWDAIERSTYDFGGIRFISSYGALFIHQYLHVWTDLRGRRDRYADYVQNSVLAIRAHKTWCMLQHGRFSWIDERTWGFSASDTVHGTYSAWAAPPVVGNWDGTLSPHAAGGSLTLLPEESIVVLKTMREHHPRCFGRYGFVNAFNPGANNGAGWFDSDVIAIDLALTILMAENLRTYSVSALSTRAPELRSAIRVVGLLPEGAAGQGYS